MTNTWSPWKDLMLQDAQVLITAFAYLFQGVVSFLLLLGFGLVAFMEEERQSSLN